MMGAWCGRMFLIAVAAMPSGCAPAPTESDAVLRVLGRTGLGPGEFSYPRAGVVGRDGRLYLVDKSGRIQCFDEQWKFLLEWTMPEYIAGKPTGLGVGPDGRIYAADTHYARVVVFEPEGTLVGAFGSWGDGPGQFRLPTDVAVDRAGFIYVSEYGGNDRISKFAPDHTYLFSFGRRDQRHERTERPQSLVIARDDSLWVADSCNHRILHFDLDGNWLGEFGRIGSGVGELRFPYGIDELPDGTLVVCEYGNNRVQRFSPDGTSLGVFGRAGRRTGELAYPWAAVCGGGQRLYIVDSGNNRVQVVDGLARRTWTTP
jgi:DNA-binding beta-propeller fold protein YncE